MHDILANPMWSALSTCRAALAQSSGKLKRFAPDVAPFCAVQYAGCELGALDCMHAGEAVYFLGTAPALPAGWTLESEYQGTTFRQNPRCVRAAQV